MEGAASVGLRSALRLDTSVSHHFQCFSGSTIDHAILMGMLEKTLADERVLDLCQRILVSGQGVLAQEYHMVYFPGDDLFVLARPRGLPIGNLTSQFWANVYLNEFDHFVKRQLKCPGYIRYVDDLCLFADDKPTLHAWKAAVVSCLTDLRLTIHTNNAQPRPTCTGVPFLGFQVFPDYRRLKRPKVIHARRKLKALARSYTRGEITLAQMTASVISWLNHASYGDTWGLRHAALNELKIAPPGGAA